MTEAAYLRLQSERTGRRLRAVLCDAEALERPGLAELARRHPLACVAVAVGGGLLAARLLRHLGPGALRHGAGLASRVAGPVLRAAFAGSLGLPVR